MLKYAFRYVQIWFIISKHRLFFDNPLNIPKIILIFGQALNLIFYPPAIFKNLFGSDIKFGDRLCAALQELGPIYIKFGQTLSTRPDIVGIDIAEALKKLQDQLDAFPGKQARQIIEEQLEAKISDIFSEFDEHAVAAASIAQVHKARLKTGEQVAVKLLRPNIEKTYQRDIKFFYFTVAIINFFDKNSKRFRVKEMVGVLERAMKIELDLKYEAAACSELKENLQDDKMILVPAIFWQYTQTKIMAQEWVDGVPLKNIEQIRKMKIKPQELARNIALTFFNQAYRDGYFHADMHPGNILVLKNGHVAFLDFGIMGYLDDKDKYALAQILYGFLKKDYKLIADIHLEVGYIPADTDLRLFSQACRTIGERIVGLPIHQISVGNLLTELFAMADIFKMELQPQLILWQKTILMVEGIAQMLDPKINIWLILEPWIKDWAIHNITPEAKFINKVKKLFKQAVKEVT